MGLILYGQLVLNNRSLLYCYGERSVRVDGMGGWVGNWRWSVEVTNVGVVGGWVGGKWVGGLSG